MQKLNPQELSTQITLNQLKFSSTKELVSNEKVFEPGLHAWIAQSEAKKAAMFGLNMRQAGFNVLVLGQHGSGRTSLIQSAMKQVAKTHGFELSDLVAVYNFEQANQPVLIKLPVGAGAKLVTAMDDFARLLVAELPSLVATKELQTPAVDSSTWLKNAMQPIKDICVESKDLNQYLALVTNDILSFFKAWQAPATSELENVIDSIVNDGFLTRFRINLLVDNRVTINESLLQPVVYDNDPSYQSLFGSLESGSEQVPEFLRLRAGNLHKANDGMLLIQLRDLLSDEQNGNQILEKLYRFLRNGTLQFEDSSGSGHGAAYVLANTLMPIKVKLVLVAMREDFYNLLEENPDFFDYFPVKVEFADSINANDESYAAIAGFIAQKSEQHQCQHFSVEAVAVLISALQRLEEDQARISTNFAYLERLMLESVFYAGESEVVSQAHVKAAINARNHRHQFFETQIRDSITDNELLIQVDGAVVGQVNGLTHIELGDASFGSPIRITARCYPGQKGLINIDREVNMSGPNHDKGIFILQNWLSASFSHLAPLSLNASLVFEQEYNGVEGDSASCAELFALLSALAGLPIQQGIAITGALNQFGEVMPIGGVNEKIEGYYRVCKALGLNGKQGVIIPKRNQRHLLLDAEVVQAVKDGLFSIITIDHVLEGIQYLVNVEAGQQDTNGTYPPDTVMGHAQSTLAAYRKTLEHNQPNTRQQH